MAFLVTLPVKRFREQPVKYTFVKSDAGISGLQLTFPRGPASTAPKLSAEALIPFEHLRAGNIAKAMEGYREIKKATPDNAAVSEDRLNSLGYGFLRQKKLPEALAYFKLNVEFYPNSWNVYDSLAEGHMERGEKELAISNFKKSLEMNPKNNNAVEMLKKLQ